MIKTKPIAHARLDLYSAKSIVVLLEPVLVSCRVRVESCMSNRLCLNHVKLALFLSQFLKPTLAWRVDLLLLLELTL